MFGMVHMHGGSGGLLLSVYCNLFPQPQLDVGIKIQ